MILNKNQIESSFIKIKNIFPLGNWKVSLKIVNNDEMAELVDCNSNTYASLHYRPHLMQAILYFNIDAVYIEGDTYEITIAHEFVHLMLYDKERYLQTCFNDVSISEFYKELSERSIELMAQAIINSLYYKME